METTSSLKIKRKIVKESIEKQESWAFMDTKCRVDKKIAFKWNTLVQEFQCKEFQAR
jgi:3-methyladenine DNA glycosylase AlkD